MSSILDQQPLTSENKGTNENTDEVCINFENYPPVVIKEDEPTKHPYLFYTSFLLTQISLVLGALYL